MRLRRRGLGSGQKVALLSTSYIGLSQSLHAITLEWMG